MAILSFKKQFVADILSGKKKQTIRGFRKYPIKVGERLYLYTGLRTKYTKKLGEAICKGTFVIKITKSGMQFKPFTKITDKKRLDQHARSDGFKDWDEMKQFWIDNNSLPFEGTVIHWSGFKPIKQKTINLKPVTGNL